MMKSLATRAVTSLAVNQCVSSHLAREERRPSVHSQLVALLYDRQKRTVCGPQMFPETQARTNIAVDIGELCGSSIRSSRTLREAQVLLRFLFHLCLILQGPEVEIVWGGRLRLVSRGRMVFELTKY